MALLALLATAPRATLSRERLLAYLWPEYAERDARHVLNVAVHVLRRELGRGAIRTVGDTLRLDTSLVRPDTLEFEDAIRRADAATAAAVYAGPFMDGFFVNDAPAFGEWQEAERRRYATLAANAIEALAAESEATGDWRTAIQWWERRFREDPATARVALRLMRALEAVGDLARALSTAQHHAHIVESEFGVEPHPDVLAEVERIRASPASLVPLVGPASVQGVGAAVAADAVHASGAAAWRGPAADGHVALDSPHAEGASTRAWSRFRWYGLAAVVVIALVPIVLIRQGGTTQAAHAGAVGAPLATSRDSIAFDHYLRGRFLWSQRSEAALLQARAEFESAIERDSTYAQAFSGLADTYLLMPSYGGAPAQQGFERAWAAADRGFALDSASAETRTSLAQVLTEFRRDRRAAERHFRAAIAADPKYATARHWYALFLASERRTEEALEQIAAAREIEPLSRIIAAAAGAVHYLARDWPAAIEEYSAALALQPDFARGHALLGRAQLGDGDGTAAIASFERAVALTGGDPGHRLLLAHALASVGRVSEARGMLAQLDVDDVPPRDRPLPAGVEPFTLAAVWVALGESERAFALLERAVDEYDTGIEYLYADPRFDVLRDGPRFRRLLDRLGF